MESRELQGVNETATDLQHLTMDTLSFLQGVTDQTSTIEEIAPNVMFMRILLVNICFINNTDSQPNNWVLIDTGLPNSSKAIIEVSKQYFDSRKPAGIILTHGHFDHVGAVTELIEHWNIPVYAHELEIPFLTGKSNYFPADPSVSDGLMAKLSPMYPNQAINLGKHVEPLPNDNTIPFLPDWRWIHTPGHTPGHVSLFRDVDRVLIAGDAITTVKQDSAVAVINQDKEIDGPPPYFTTEWNKAWESVKELNKLKPSIVITGHGLPLVGNDLSEQLDDLARNFDNIAIPNNGRYVR